MYYIYLHGFASSPRSRKAKYLGDRFAEIDIPLQILDLNQGNFAQLTLSRQLKQAAAAFPDEKTPITLIGSSFGGLTAAWLAQKYSQVDRLVCLAPAFGFLEHWSSRLEAQQLRQWQETGYLSVYHYGEDRELPLHYQFLTDMQQYSDATLQPSQPTLILHGIGDEIIPISASRYYQNTRDRVTLIELDSDHTLSNVLPQIWHEIKQFCF